MKINKIFLFLLLNTFVLSAQKQSKETFNLKEPIPFNPEVKVGKLANGLTYYILQNAKPKDKAELRLIIKAGSILEDEDQQGLAHFVEHMAFNGTKTFHKNELIDYLQNIGVEFGADLNAHTGYDETVYKLSVPVNNDTIYDTGLQILRDWADGIEFSDEEIDNERGVVAEELRARSGSDMRMYYKSIPVLTNNSRYARRVPAGKLDIVLNGKYEAIKRFYNDWYRPDLMAVVIVGDIDITKTENKIKAVFGSLKPKANPKKRIEYTISDNQNPNIAILKDKEASKTLVSIYYKQQNPVTETMADYKEKLLVSLYTGMLQQRLSEKAETKDAPFLSAKTGFGHFLADKSSYYLGANSKENDVATGIEALLTESERARRYGFSDSELKRYKDYILNNARLLYKETGKVPSTYYVEHLTDYFTDNKPFPGSRFNYEFYKKELPGITVEEVNQVADKLISNQNIAIVIKAPESANLPTEQWINTTLSSVTSKKIEPYRDSFKGKELMKTKPHPGTIISTAYNKEIGLTTWELSNGVTVLAKPTQLQNDLISMSAYRPGGSSVAPDSLYISARNAGSIIGGSGFNTISATDLKKMNLGKTVSVKPVINFYEDIVNATASTEQLERMLQMVHLYFTAPNKDQNVFDTYKANSVEFTKGLDNSPGAYFDKEVSEIMTNNHLRAVPLSYKQIEDNLNLEESFNFYKERFASANGFTFIFVGNFDLDTLQKLVEQHIASLPSNLEEESNWRDIGLRYATGRIKKTFVKGIENKSRVDLRYMGTLDFTLDKKEQISYLAQLLKIKLTQELREKMADVYGVRVSGFATKTPYEWYRLNVQFTCNPENVDVLIEKVHDEIDKIKANGAQEVDLNKIKKAALENKNESLKYNGNWIYMLKEAKENNLKYESILDYKTKIDKLNSNSFKEAANTYFNEDNYTEFILMPEKK